MDNLAIGFILIGAAFLLLLAELMLTTGGVLLVIAGILDFVGVAMVFRYGDSYVGFVTIAAEAVLLPIAAGLGLYIWPRTPMGRRLILRRNENAGSTLASNPIFQELDQLRGRIGKATSVLRPSGVVEFDGRRIDCMSEGILIEPETWVRCIDVRAGHVIVRPIDGPDLKDFETETFA